MSSGNRQVKPQDVGRSRHSTQRRIPRPRFDSPNGPFRRFRVSASLARSSWVSPASFRAPGKLVATAETLSTRLLRTATYHRRDVQNQAA